MNSNKFEWVDNEVNLKFVKELASELNVSNIISKILVSRGVDNYAAAQNYFTPNFNQFHDGFLMK